jgi:hemerythrin superfamily protein
MKESVIYQAWQAENEELGRIQERKNLALKMIQQGATLDFVARVTGFSIDQIHELQTVHH